MGTNYDVIIIGSGVVGSSIAYHLSERKNKAVLVIDQSFPLAGTSGSTQAWVWVHNKTPSWYAELNMFSAELYPFLERKIGDVEYNRTGGIAPFFNEEDRERALRLVEEQAKVGIEVEVLNNEQVRAKEPSLSNSIAGATYSRIDGNVNPFRLVELYIKAAKKNGVQFSFYNAVTDVETSGETFNITTEKETFTCEKLIMAAGPWTHELGKLLHLDIPVKQVRGQIIVTEPLSPFLNHTIGGVRQADNGEVLIGYSHEHVGYDRRTTMDVIQDTASMAMRFIPDLKKANIVRCFSGIRALPEDGLPILGKVPYWENLYIAAMHSGITLSPLVGTLMTELLNEGDTSIDLHRFCLDRFEGHTIG